MYTIASGDQSASINIYHATVNYGYAVAYESTDDLDNNMRGSVTLSFSHGNDETIYLTVLMDNLDKVDAMISNLTRIVDECTALRIKFENQQEIEVQ